MNNTVLPDSTGNCVQYPVIDHSGKEKKKKKVGCRNILAKNDEYRLDHMVSGGTLCCFIRGLRGSNLGLPLPGCTVWDKSEASPSLSLILSLVTWV